MKTCQGITLGDVQTVYSGYEGELWELIMGEQIHIGGFSSSMDLAEKAEIGAGDCGVDLCCCTGAGMRFLVKFRDVSHMQGVDATEKVIRQGLERCRKGGMGQRVEFIQASATETGLERGGVDFVWGEDAWCYVEDKPALIAEAARIARQGGKIAFTDWIEGPEELTDAEAQRLMAFMKFPSLQDLGGYQDLLTAHGCQVLTAENTGRFAPYIDLYLNMLEKQLTYDALRIIGFDLGLMQSLAGELAFMQEMAHAGKIAQGLFVAEKR